MSDSSTTGIDPRFDPRFQRGYTDASADAPAPAQSPYPPRLGAVPPASPPAFDATARLLEAMERTMPARPPLRPPTGLAGAADAAEGAGDRLDDGRSNTDADLDAPVPQPEPEDGNRHERPWFIAGWLLSAALLTIGSWWVWAVNSDAAVYSGVSIADMAFHQLGWSLAPTFMQAGAIGLALVTSFAASRQLDRAALRRTTDDAVGDPADGRRGFWRTPGVIALIAIVAASAILVIWLVGRAVDGSVFGYGPSPSEDEISRMALAQIASTAVGPLTLAAVGAMFGIILLGARHARRIGSVDDVSGPPAR